jgi:hypothetical protein
VELLSIIKKEHARNGMLCFQKSSKALDPVTRNIQNNSQDSRCKFRIMQARFGFRFFSAGNKIY